MRTVGMMPVEVQTMFMVTLDDGQIERYPVKVLLPTADLASLASAANELAVFKEEVRKAPKPEAMAEPKPIMTMPAPSEKPSAPAGVKLKPPAGRGSKPKAPVQPVAEGTEMIGAESGTPNHKRN